MKNSHDRSEPIILIVKCIAANTHLDPNHESCQQGQLCMFCLVWRREDKWSLQAVSFFTYKSFATCIICATSFSSSCDMVYTIPKLLWIVCLLSSVLEGCKEQLNSGGSSHNLGGPQGTSLRKILVCFSERALAEGHFWGEADSPWCSLETRAHMFHKSKQEAKKH